MLIERANYLEISQIRSRVLNAQGDKFVHLLQELSDSCDFFIVSGVQAVITTRTEQDMRQLYRDFSLPFFILCLSYTYSNNFQTTTHCHYTIIVLSKNYICMSQGLLGSFQVHFYLFHNDSLPMFPSLIIFSGLLVENLCQSSKGFCKKVHFIYFSFMTSL